MSQSEVIVSRLTSTTETDFVFPSGFSFFNSFIQHSVKEILEIGGEAYVSRSSNGTISGIFIYDESEKIGTIYTRSRAAFDYFYKLKPFNFIFAELDTEHENEIYDLYTMDLANLSLEYRFSHEISLDDSSQMDDIKRFMISTHLGINKKWVNVAFNNGERCLVAKVNGEIAGLGWLSIVNRIGRIHSLYVKPQFRGLKIGRDILYARLFWLKSKQSRRAFSEISRENSPSSKIAMNAGMKISGQIFQYFRKDPVK